jgi:hypothetical protein
VNIQQRKETDMNTPHHGTPNRDTPNRGTPNRDTRNQDIPNRDTQNRDTPIRPRPVAGACSRRMRHALAAGAATFALVAASCSGSISHSYRTFESALDRGASCEELFDQRARFRNDDTLAQIDRDLSEIGCATPDSQRTDR